MFIIVDYGVGNLTSVQNMLKKAGHKVSISGKAEDIQAASRLLLPGMGHFDNCMRKFNDSGLRPLIEKKVFDEKIPVLGICVGLQMFMASSEEGTEPGLGWIEGRTVRFKPEQMNGQLKIPNMGWLETTVKKKVPLMNELEEARFYFAHSYHVVTDHEPDQLLEASYGYTFTAGIQKNNIMGVQFHPEKSHRFGMQLLRNFATIG